MKTKSKKNKNNVGCQTEFSPYDLFGEIPVYWSEIATWVSIITRGRFTINSRSFMFYVENWNVAGKIRAVKSRGDLQDYLNGVDRW